MILKKFNLGCAAPPLHPQDLALMGGSMEGWGLVDFYVNHPDVLQWNIEELVELPDNWAEAFVVDHVLEHISHSKIPYVLRNWYKKLAPGGTLSIVVPNLLWALNLVKKLEAGQVLDGYYNEYWGPHGVMSVIYGTHSRPGEYHNVGFTPKTLEAALREAGFSDITLDLWFEGHDIECLYAVCKK